MRSQKKCVLNAMKGLSRKENQVAGLVACGLAKKEIADELNIAYGTVNIHIDNAYKKTGTNKLNELGAWWINKKFNLNINWSDMKKQIIATCCLLLVCVQLTNVNASAMRARTRRTNRTEYYEMD